MITTKEELIKMLDKEIAENKYNLEHHGFYKDDYIPGNILYGVPEEIIVSVLKENPEYYRHWPLLKEWLD